MVDRLKAYKIAAYTLFGVTLAVGGVKYSSTFNSNFSDFDNFSKANLDKLGLSEHSSEKPDWYIARSWMDLDRFVGFEGKLIVRYSIRGSGGVNAEDFRLGTTGVKDRIDQEFMKIWNNRSNIDALGYYLKASKDGTDSELRVFVVPYFEDKRGYDEEFYLFKAGNGFSLKLEDRRLLVKFPSSSPKIQSSWVDLDLNSKRYVIENYGAYIPALILAG